MKDHPKEKTEQEEKKEKQEDPETEKDPAAGEQPDEISLLKAEIASVNDKFIRLYSEFENYKKRVLKERVELGKMAAAELVLGLLPVLDDFDRAAISIDKASELNAVKEGIRLVHLKFRNLLEQKGLQEMKSEGDKFDTDLHEAVTSTAAPSEGQKGTILEVLEKGYLFNGKVIRHPKVVIGQ